MMQVHRNAVVVLLKLVGVAEIFVFGNVLLDASGQVLLNELGDMVPVDSMTVADTEEMKAQLVDDIGHENVGVLVLLVWVAWLMAHTRSKGKLGDAVKPLCGHLVGSSLLCIGQLLSFF